MAKAAVDRHGEVMGRPQNNRAGRQEARRCSRFSPRGTPGGTTGGVGPSSGGVAALMGGSMGSGGVVGQGGTFATGGSGFGGSEGSATGGAPENGTGGGAMGMSGVSGVGGAATGGAVRGCSNITGAFVCNDFESPAASWGPKDRGQGSIDRDTSQVRQGSFALHAYSAASADYALQVVSLPSRVTSGELYVRTFFFLPSSLNINDWLVALELKSCATCSEKISFDLAPGDIAMLSRSGVPSVKGAPASLPRNRWFCVELAVTLSSTGSVRLLVDGSTVASMPSVNTLLSGAVPAGIAAFRLGFITGPNQGPVELWADALVASPQAIGCN